MKPYAKPTSRRVDVQATATAFAENLGLTQGQASHIFTYSDAYLESWGPRRDGWTPRREVSAAQEGGDGD